MISGFTTTGATVVSDVEGLTKGSLFWRSFSHWIGGMGVLVFLLAIVPMAGGSHMNLMKAESRDLRLESWFRRCVRQPNICILFILP